MSVRRNMGTATVAVLFLLPLFAGLLLFQWIPLILAVKNSFYQLSLLNPKAAHYLGLDNYRNLAESPRFTQAFINSLIYTAGKIFIQIPLALLLAVFLNQGIRGTTVVRGAVFAALVASEAVIALIWNIMYDPSNGLINVLLNAVSIPKQPFLTSTSQALPSILAMVIWKDIGFTMLILLAGLQAIPDEYYEAASLDGAGPWRKLYSITVPLLRRSLLLAMFMATLSGFRIFTPILLMTEGGPQNATINVIYYMYDRGFRFLRMGEASAAAVVMIGLLAIITLVQGRLLRTNYD